MRVGIVHYRDDAAVGGSLRMAELLAGHLNPAVVEAHLIFTYGGPGPVAAQAAVPCHFLQASGPTDVIAWRRARRVLSDLDCDILHFQSPAAWLWWALAGTRYLKLLHLHRQMLPALVALDQRAVLRTLARRGDGVVCVNRATADRMVKNGWGRPGRVWTVRNAIDCRRFEELPPRGAARMVLKVPQGPRVAAIVGNLCRVKGCFDAIELITRLSDEWHLVFVGDGVLRSELQRLAVSRGLRNRVHFTGVVDDPRIAYAAADAIIVMSFYESFGLTIAEAMAARVPVFGLTGLGEYAEPEYPLVTPGNAIFIKRTNPLSLDRPESPAVLEALAQTIREYGNRPASYSSMIANARDWVRSRFDAPMHAAAMCQVYEELMAPQKARAAGS